jgi:hypothetical protein
VRGSFWLHPKGCRDQLAGGAPRGHCPGLVDVVPAMPAQPAVRWPSRAPPYRCMEEAGQHSVVSARRSTRGRTIGVGRVTRRPSRPGTLSCRGPRAVRLPLDRGPAGRGQRAAARSVAPRIVASRSAAPTCCRRSGQQQAPTHNRAHNPVQNPHPPQAEGPVTASAPVTGPSSSPERARHSAPSPSSVPSYRPISLPSVSTNAAHQLVGLISVFGRTSRPPSSVTLRSVSSIESTST